jgi:hypothetical protein
LRGGLFLRFLRAVERCDRLGSVDKAAPSLKRKALFSTEGDDDLAADLTFVLNNIHAWNGIKYAAIDPHLSRLSFYLLFMFVLSFMTASSR